MRLGSQLMIAFLRQPRTQYFFGILLAFIGVIRLATGSTLSGVLLLVAGLLLCLNAWRACR
jgi:hypothetical protein